MDIYQIAATGYALTSVAYVVMAVLLILRWPGHARSPMLTLASVLSAFWAVGQTLYAIGTVEAPALLVSGEIARGVAWATVMWIILRSFGANAETNRRVGQSAAAIALVVAVIFILLWQMSEHSLISGASVALGLFLAITVVVLSEQVGRNAPLAADPQLRYFCATVAGIFLFELVVISLSAISGQPSVELWAARGYVNFLLAIPLITTSRRRFNLSLDTLLPRQIVFYSFGVVTIAILLFVVYLGDLYIRRFGGGWAEVLRIVLASVLVFAVAIIAISPSIRARFRVAVMKALFQYKYDYRREWLRFIATLTQSDRGQPVADKAVQAIAQIVNSPGGAVWAQGESDTYQVIGSWNCEVPDVDPVSEDSRLIRFLNERQWVIDIDELEDNPAHYGEGIAADLPVKDDEWWLLVPMLLGERLSGFLMFHRPADVPVLNFEDHDLLKTAGRHVATHIEQDEADKRLAEASQFGAYNRLTAFLMHDLNNLLAQQSLVVENAERFRDNPEFVDDAFDTITHSVARMRGLMEQLSLASKRPVTNRVALGEVVSDAVSRAQQREPRPSVSGPTDNLYVEADGDRLAMIVGHLLRNAQDASEETGQVTLALDDDPDQGVVHITIEDTGIGMSGEFMRTRLFRPFDSTKGNQGMGIGAYQAREYIQSIGGTVKVTSQLGVGTVFRLSIPSS